MDHLAAETGDWRLSLTDVIVQSYGVGREAVLVSEPASVEHHLGAVVGVGADSELATLLVQGELVETHRTNEAGIKIKMKSRRANHSVRVHYSVSRGFNELKIDLYRLCLCPYLCGAVL